MADDDRLMYTWKLRGGKIPRRVKRRLPKKSERVVKKPDRRRKVRRSDIKKGGRFRSVVKVRTVIGDWKHEGTGWLIRDNLVVTAGHLVVDVPFENCNMQTFATIVQVYIGYRGKDAMDSPHVDFRKGTRVVVPWDYAVKKKSVNDFAFVQLDQPFHNVSPIKPYVTPHSNTAELCVVGYPGDKKKRYIDGEEERGAEMYEDCAQVTWDLESHEGLLAYQISTYGGNSESPVLYKENGITFAIGTHVKSDHIWNFASPITEESVNSYDLIINRFFSRTWPKPYKLFNDTHVEVHRFHLAEPPPPPSTPQPLRPPRRANACRMQRIDGHLQPRRHGVRHRRAP